MKFFHARVSNVVGFDPDYNGIHSTTDGAISRYDNMRRKYPQFPKMEFIVLLEVWGMAYQSRLEWLSQEKKEK